jgi:hypothetical protein
MTVQRSVNRPDRDIDAEAQEALDAARAMPHGPERIRALKEAGVLRNIADRGGPVFARRGRPRKD